MVLNIFRLDKSARAASKPGVWWPQPAILIVSSYLGWWLFDAIALKLTCTARKKPLYCQT
jgi:hypothetical protein